MKYTSTDFRSTASSLLLPLASAWFLQSLTGCTLLTGIQAVDAGVDAGNLDAGNDPADAGNPEDAGENDAGDNPIDAGDAGDPEDAGEPDAGDPEDAGENDAGPECPTDFSFVVNQCLENDDCSKNPCAATPELPLCINGVQDFYCTTDDWFDFSAWPSQGVTDFVAVGATLLDTRTQLQWSNIRPPASQTTAARLCEELAFDGYTDWHLATRIELSTLIDFNRTQPATSFPPLREQASDERIFWSATPTAEDNEKGWRIDFADGNFKIEGTLRSAPYICVRSGFLAAARTEQLDDPHYTVNANDNIDFSVVDNRTGLEWQQSRLAQDSTFTDAVAFCNNLNYNGNTDWRLPTVAELLTLVDLRVTAPTIDLVFFPNTPTVPFWSSTLLFSDTNQSWIVDFDRGGMATFTDDFPGAARCVR